MKAEKTKILIEVPVDLKEAFEKECKKSETTMSESIRKHMTRVTSSAIKRRK